MAWRKNQCSKLVQLICGRFARLPLLKRSCPHSSPTNRRETESRHSREEQFDTGIDQHHYLHSSKRNKIRASNRDEDQKMQLPALYFCGHDAKPSRKH